MFPVVAGAAWALESARIDDHTALVASPAAPLADRGGDAAAVWCAVPTAPDGSVLVFLHGNDGYVTASAAHPDGYLPSWAAGPAPAGAVGPAYHLADLAEVGRLRPVVLAPEVGVRDASRPAWAVTSAGRFGDPAVEDPLGSLVTDVSLRLRGLGYAVPDPGRVLIAAHSGGGRAAAALLGGGSLTGRAVDVLLLDATYGWGETSAWLDLLRSWQAGASSRGNRLVLAYLAGTGTQVQAVALATAARAAGLPVTSVAWGAPDRDEQLARATGLVSLSIPKGVVAHGAMPLDVLPVLVRTAR
jgi:hypothetical protein